MAGMFAIGSHLRLARALLPAAAAAFVASGGAAPAQATSYNFQDIINPGDPTFNQALGINNSGEIVGYFGSGMAGHPNQGYRTSPPYTSFTGENFPGSVQTQVTGINDLGTTVGFWSNTNMGVGLDSNFGFVDQGGVFTNVNNPDTFSGTPSFNQLLGVNNADIAVGFYVNVMDQTFGYTYDIATNTFSAPINDPSGVFGTTMATAINNSGEIGGIYTSASTGEQLGFIDSGGTFTTISVPGAFDVMVLGLNDDGYAVGTYSFASGAMFGFVYDLNNGTYQTISDPFGIGFTTINGINDRNQLVGFYVNGAGNDIGLVATPATPVPEPSSLLLLVSGLAGVGAFARRRKAGNAQYSVGRALSI